MNMRLKSPGLKLARAAVAAGAIRALLVLSTTCVGGAAGISSSLAQEAATDVAYVVAVSGRVVALARGTPVLLDNLDNIADRTRLDLLPNSELHLCHYRTQQIVILRGPARATISADGMRVEAGKVVDGPTETCIAPVVTRVNGGLLTRGAGFKR
jgi:hypothetical protein